METTSGHDMDSTWIQRNCACWVVSLYPRITLSLFTNDFCGEEHHRSFLRPFIGDQTLVNLNHLSHHAIHGSPSGNIMSKSRLSVDV